MVARSLLKYKWGAPKCHTLNHVIEWPVVTNSVEDDENYHQLLWKINNDLKLEATGLHMDPIVDIDRQKWTLSCHG